MKSSNKLVFLLIFALATVCGGVSSSDAAPKKLVSIAVTPINPSIVLGTTEQFTATGTYSDNSTQNLTTSVTWSSSAKSVATISNAAGSKGKATSKAVGTTTITATSGNISGSTTLTVTALVSIAVSPTSPSIVLGATEQFTATGTYSDNSTQNLTASVTWSSSAGSIATISNAAGLKGRATSKAAGTTTITAKSGNVSGSTTLTVTALVSIAVSPTSPSIVLGATEQFTATGTYSDNSTQNLTASVTWSSSAGSVATISNAAGSNGNATSVAAGTTTVTAKSGRFSGSTTLTVTPATLVSIAVTPVNPSIVLGMTEQFTATGTYSNNNTQNITTSVTWSSSAGSVATISNTAGSNGKATSVAVGTTTITATSGNISGSTTLTVTPATLVSIAVTPTNPSVVLGATEQFTAIGTYSDNSTKNLTALVTWSSSAGPVATISNTPGSNGKATSVAVGTTTITAASGSISGSTTLTMTPGGNEANNVLPITVNGSLCSANSYPNKPCVSITVCTPGTSTCQTIDDVLLDTGSYGLRLFKQVLSVSLVQATGDSGSLAECIQYGDGSSDWGPVQIASVILGNEPAVQVPIQVVDSTFRTAPPSCKNADQSPSDAGFNGILGVGPFVQDCGSTCSNSAGNGMYYGCNGSTCTETSVLLSNQVQNPVALLPQDNNGVIVQLPSVPQGGAPSVSGSLMLGIGTQSNNVPSAVTTYTLDQNGEFITTFNNRSYFSFIDTGSNGLFFPSSGLLPNCKDYSDWFCPSSTTNLSSTIKGASGSPSGVVSFQIGNFDSLISSSNNVFADIGGNEAGGFDWGLPFFFGRDIYMGFEGSTSSLGSGPYFAY